MSPPSDSQQLPHLVSDFGALPAEAMVIAKRSERAALGQPRAALGTNECRDDTFQAVR